MGVLLGFGGDRCRFNYTIRLLSGLAVADLVYRRKSIGA